MKLQQAKFTAPAMARPDHAPQPCAPRLGSTHTDRVPMVYRPGALDAAALPSVAQGTRTWPDGRKEPA